MSLIQKRLEEKRPLDLMTHVVAGYPNFETNRELIYLMEESGVGYVEIQIPFSDPMADGPTIMKANQLALDAGVTFDKCLKFASEITSKVSIPILFMTYGNVPFVRGMEQFCGEVKSAGVSGLIIPDLPFDEEIDSYYECAKAAALTAVPVISPHISKERLVKIGAITTGFLYTTLKVGITGVGEVAKGSTRFLDEIRNSVSVPIAAGFGISSPGDVQMMRGKADIAVIGSHVINLYDNEGIASVKSFLKNCIDVAK